MPALSSRRGRRARRTGGVSQDLRFAWRALKRRPAFAIIAIVTLALGIGLNTSMFSLANSLLLRPLPFPDVDRIARLYRATPDNQYGDFSAADYLSLKDEESSFGQFAAYQLSNATMDGVPGSIQWLLASAGMFDVLGVHPFLGRAYTAQDDRAGTRVAVISYRLWQQQFASDRNIVGHLARAGDESFEIIGVLPASAHDHRLFGRVGIFSPLRMQDDARTRASTARVGIIGRRRSDLAAGSAAALVANAGQRLGAARQADTVKVSWRSEALPLSTTGPTGKLLVAMLIGLASCVLLIACSNLANVLLAGAIERRRESAVRAALGASRVQLVRPLLFEALLLALAGGAAAMLVAIWTSGWLRANLTDAGGVELPLDWRVLAFAAISCAMTAIGVGLAPGLFALRTDPNVALGAGGRTLTSGTRQRRVRNVLIAAQFALATILLTGAGLFLSGTTGLLTQDYGWRSDHVLQGSVQLPADRYDDDGAIAAFYGRVIEQLRRLPGVTDASVSYGLPYLGLRGRADVRAEDDATSPRLGSMLNGTSAAYFRVTGTRLVSGRVFADTDTAEAPKVAIVSESLGRALFHGQSAVGRRVTMADSEADRWEIVGVVADASPVDIAQAPNAFQIYQPAAQDPHASAIIALRTGGVPPETLAGALRAAIAELDPAVLVKDVSPAEALVDSIGSQVLVVRQLLNAFAALGTFLALIGIYGVMSRMVIQRTPEIGIRLALGAQVRSVLQLIVAAGVRVAAVGTAVGVSGALVLSRVIANGFPGMHANGTLIAVTAVAVLLSVAVCVCLLSARRVTTINPVEALRVE